METSSYLFMSKRKRQLFSSRIMEKHSSSDSNLSVDSLEADRNNASNRMHKNSEDNVETILVPFYENDVLMKVPKDGKAVQKKKETNKRTKPPRPPTYLANKDKNKTTSYLHMFQKQIEKVTHKKKPEDKEECEISSVYPEFGDTEPESICEDDCASARIAEFCNSEPYNELFYEQLLSQQIYNLLSARDEEALHFTEDLEENSLRSVSDVSQPRRTRREPVAPVPNNFQLGGLGPDMQALKPRLERAKSLQRYSERIRMDNRLKIYRNLVTHNTEIDFAPKKTNSSRERSQTSRKETSYLVNKTQANKEKASKKETDQKNTKSADTQRGRESLREKYEENAKHRNSDILSQVGQEVLKRRTQNDGKAKGGKKDDTPKIGQVKSISKAINTEADSTDTDGPPVQISFKVNLKGGLRSSALKSLEEKHRMYQEKVKGYTGDNYDF